MGRATRATLADQNLNFAAVDIIGLNVLHLVADQPHMPKALCRNRELWPVFDAAMTPSDVKAQDAASRVCSGCVHVLTCQRWYLSLDPDQRPAGVVGGLLPPRKPKQPASGPVNRPQINGERRKRLPWAGTEAQQASRRAHRQRLAQLCGSDTGLGVRLTVTGNQ